MEPKAEYKKKTDYPRKVDWSTYKFRCSMLGELMPGPRAKPGELQSTEQTALTKLYLQAVWGVTEDVSTKQMDKGTIQESEGIALMTSVQYPGDFIPKNTVRFSNDYLTGEPDVCIDSLSKVHDIKCPWSLHTFVKSEMTKGYEWQLRGYMWLKNYQNAELNYTLVDCPEEMIQDEIRKQAFYGGFIDEYSPEFVKKEAQIRHNMTFDYIPAEMRVKSFELTRDESLELQIRDRALLWRSVLSKMTL